MYLSTFLHIYLILKAGKPELPLKRSKSMKSNIKPVSVIPIINQTSFNQYRYVMYNITDRLIKKSRRLWDHAALERKGIIGTYPPISDVIILTYLN